MASLEHRRPLAIGRAAAVTIVLFVAPSPAVVGSPVTDTPVAQSRLRDACTDLSVVDLPSPTAVEQLPNGRVVVLEQLTGRVRLIDGETGLLDALALDLDVCGGAERGLLGFTHDPDIGRSGRVYVFYTRAAPGEPGDCVNRVSAFALSGDTIDPGSAQVLRDNTSSVNGRCWTGAHLSAAEISARSASSVRL